MTMIWRRAIAEEVAAGQLVEGPPGFYRRAGGCLQGRRPLIRTPGPGGGGRRPGPPQRRSLVMETMNDVQDTRDEARQPPMADGQARKEATA